MKLKNVCPYRAGQKVYCPRYENSDNACPIVRLEKPGQNWRVWVRDRNGREGYWTETPGQWELVVVE